MVTDRLGGPSTRSLPGTAAGGTGRGASPTRAEGVGWGGKVAGRSARTVARAGETVVGRALGRTGGPSPPSGPPPPAGLAFCGARATTRADGPAVGVRCARRGVRTAWDPAHSAPASKPLPASSTSSRARVVRRPRGKLRPRGPEVWVALTGRSLLIGSVPYPGARTDTPSNSAQGRHDARAIHQAGVTVLDQPR